MKDYFNQPIKTGDIVAVGSMSKGAGLDVGIVTNITDKAISVRGFSNDAYSVRKNFLAIQEIRPDMHVNVYRTPESVLVLSYDIIVLLKRMRLEVTDGE